MQQNTSGTTFFTSKNSYPHMYPHYQSRPQITHSFFFSFPSLRFSFLASSTAFSPAPRRLSFFPHYINPAPKSSIPFFSFPSLRLALVSLCYVLADERNMLLHTNAFSIGNYVLAISDNI